MLRRERFPRRCLCSTSSAFGDGASADRHDVCKRGTDTDKHCNVQHVRYPTADAPRRGPLRKACARTIDLRHDFRAFPGLSKRRDATSCSSPRLSTPRRRCGESLSRSTCRCWAPLLQARSRQGRRARGGGDDWRRGSGPGWNEGHSFPMSKKAGWKRDRKGRKSGNEEEGEVYSWRWRRRKVYSKLVQ